MQSNKLRKEKEAQIFQQLESIGIKPSDTVLLNINLGKFGLLSGYRRKDYVQLFKTFFPKAVELSLHLRSRQSASLS